MPLEIGTLRGRDNAGDTEESPTRLSGNGSEKRVAVLNPELNIGPLDVRSRASMFILTIGTERQYEVSALVYHIIRLIDGRRTDEEIAESLRTLNIAELSGATVRIIIDNYFVPNGFVKSSKGIAGDTKHASSIRSRFPIFSQRQLRPITNLLRVLFGGRIFFFLFTVSAITQVYVALTFNIDFGVVAQVGGFRLILVYFVVVLTAFIHELGHSSACAYFGVSHGEIGVGIYLLFPVLYSDVSDVWHLDRKSRVIVDAGGVFFQFVSVTALYMFYVILPSPVLVASIFTTYLVILTALNPFLKFDGYWILSDLLGVTNLAKRSNETLGSVWKRIVNGMGLRLFSRDVTGRESGLATMIYCGLSCLFFIVLVIQAVFFLKLSIMKTFFELESFGSNQSGYSFIEVLSHGIDTAAAAIPVVLLAIVLFATTARAIRRFR